jgi:hypothetical protein
MLCPNFIHPQIHEKTTPASLSLYPYGRGPSLSPIKHHPKQQPIPSFSHAMRNELIANKLMHEIMQRVYNNFSSAALAGMRAGKNVVTPPLPGLNRNTY